MEHNPVQQPLGARVSAEIGRLESLLVRVGAEYSDEEEDEMDGHVAEDTRDDAEQSFRVSIPNPFAHRTEPRPCTPLGASLRSAAVEPAKPSAPQRVAEDKTGASPRQRVANVYTRVAAAVSAEYDTALQSNSCMGGDDDLSIESVLSRNIADARQALDQLER